MKTIEEYLEEFDTLINTIADSYYRGKVSADSSVGIDDLKQELAHAVMKAHNTFNPHMASFKTHFINVADNHMIDFIRKLENPGGASAQCAEEPSVDPYAVVEAEDAAIVAIRSSLGEASSDVVIAYFGLGVDNDMQSQQEIADRYAISQQRVSQIINAAVADRDLRPTIAEALAL